MLIDKRFMVISMQTRRSKTKKTHLKEKVCARFNTNLPAFEGNKILHSILSSVGINYSKTNFTIEGCDPILPSPFLIGEAGAASLTAVGIMVSELWFLKTQRRQHVHINVRDAAITQISHNYLRVIDGVTPYL